MNIGFGLRLEQTQKLIMTPELRQAIKILQLSSIELTDYLNQMILDNPLIELKEEVPERDPVGEKKDEIDWGEYLRDLQEAREKVDRNNPREVKPEITYENLLTKGTSLEEHLISQLGVIPLSREEKKIARYLIGNVNSVGYLAVTLEQAEEDLKVKKDKIEMVLALIQNFDPPGICARNLCECLSIQLKQGGLYCQEICELLENHLENIAAGKLNKVAQIMNIPVARVQEMADLIKTLNPKPGASFGGSEDIRYIIPDVTVERIDDNYVILVNEGHIPHLTINKTYSAILNKASDADPGTKEFVENKLNQALWLIRSIEQRRMTIYQVTAALVKMQEEFFEHGVKYLKPLTLKQIAEKVGVHESTVSRATSNKYIQTPHGIFEFKYFFTTGLSTDRGESASTESVRHLIQEIVKNEDPKKPYSDQKIADILQKRGISIARRTVTKYREEMHILNAGQRKRY
jgi:RNA polymerase sigma-54 factor